MVRDQAKERPSGEKEVSQEDRVRRVEELVVERELAWSEEEKGMLRWKAPARPFKERNKEFFTTVGAMVVLVCVILMFAREFLAIAVILALAFLVYVLASVRPEEVEHEVTTRGIRTGGKFYRWDGLGRFWFEEKHRHMMLVVETAATFPGRLVMLVGEMGEKKLSEVLRKYLLQERPELTLVGRSAKWLQEKVPLDES